MTADSDTIYCKCEGHRVPYAECAEPLCGKLRAEFKEATDTSPDRIEAVGRAIFAAVTSANPDAFHPAYERDREVWDDAAKSAMAVLTPPSATIAEYDRLKMEYGVACHSYAAGHGATYERRETAGAALDAFVERLIALAEAKRVVQENAT